MFDHDIQIETDFSEIMKWISGKDYTVILRDGSNRMTDIELEIKQASGLTVFNMNQKDIYQVSGLNTESDVKVDLAGDRYKVFTGSGSCVEWNCDMADLVNIIVINIWKHSPRRCRTAGCISKTNASDTGEKPVAVLAQNWISWKKDVLFMLQKRHPCSFLLKSLIFFPVVLMV